MIINILKMLAIALAGVLLLFFPVASLYTVIIDIGIALLVYGVFSVVAFLISRNRKKEGKERSEKSIERGKLVSIVIGVVALVCGIVVLVRPALIAEFFPTLVALFVIVAGVLMVIKAIGRKKESEGWKSMLAIALATVILGVILLIKPFDEGTTVRILGTVMLYLGAAGTVGEE
ncbi:MAG: DUF308 domain-containing protein [Oscillospiraceae bacterium]|nr:DUF308 domain-containing protein [Oscillospiraceae bacterium]